MDILGNIEMLKCSNADITLSLFPEVMSSSPPQGQWPVGQRGVSKSHAANFATSALSYWTCKNIKKVLCP